MTYNTYALNPHSTNENPRGGKNPPQFPVEINGLINYKTKLNTQYLDSLLSRFVWSKIEIVFVIFIYIASIHWELTPSLPVITGSRYSQVYHNPYITKFILKKEMPIN